MSRIYLSPPHMGAAERDLLLDAFDSNWVAPLGPHVDAFEREFCEITGSHAAAALSSGTAALHLALLILGVSDGDTVICPTLTFAATANAIRYCGAEPIFIDSDEASWNMSPDLLEEALRNLRNAGRPPKVVVVVDLYGQCADYQRIRDICINYEIPIIEDSAEALGATYGSTSAGRFGVMGVFSFNGNKIITTSGGGMLVSDDLDMIRKARFLATQARDAAPHYQHSSVGYNYRLSNLLAAVGRGQLRVLRERVESRRKIFDRYYSRLHTLAGVQFMPEAPYGRSTRWLTCLTIDPIAFGVSREDIRIALDLENIEARPVWKPMHLQPVFSGNQVFGGGISKRLFENGLCLPSGSSLAADDQNRVIDIVERMHHTAKPATTRA